MPATINTSPEAAAAAAGVEQELYPKGLSFQLQRLSPCNIAPHRKSPAILVNYVVYRDHPHILSLTGDCERFLA